MRLISAEDVEAVFKRFIWIKSKSSCTSTNRAIADTHQASCFPRRRYLDRDASISRSRLWAMPRETWPTGLNYSAACNDASKGSLR